MNLRADRWLGTQVLRPGWIRHYRVLSWITVGCRSKPQPDVAIPSTSPTLQYVVPYVAIDNHGTYDIDVVVCYRKVW